MEHKINQQTINDVITLLTKGKHPDYSFETVLTVINKLKNLPQLEAENKE